MRGVNVYALIKEAVAPHPVSGETSHAAGKLERGPAVDTRRLHPCRLAWRIIGHLVLEEDVGATIPVPDHLVLLVVLHEQAIGGHVVAVDYDAGIGSVVGPADAVAMIGPPGPDVIQDHVVTVDDKTGPRHTRCGTADTEEDIVERSGIAGKAMLAGSRPHLQQLRRVVRSGVEHDSGKVDAGPIFNHHRRIPLIRHQGGEAEPDHDRVSMHHADAAVQMIDARREEKVLTDCELVVDHLHRVGRPGKEESVERNG